MRLTEASRQSFRLQPTPWGAKNAACPVGEEVLDCVEPGGRGRDEVERSARMARQYFGMPIGGVVCRGRQGSPG
jgi:hypothetical protein